MTAPAIQEPTCPKCGSAMWDNRASNYQKLQEGKKLGPDWKCKQYKTGCEGVIWPPKAGAAPAAAPTGPTLVASTAPDPYALPKKSIAQIYIETTDFVLATILPKYEAKEIGCTPEAIAAMVATLFIARRKEEA